MSESVVRVRGLAKRYARFTLRDINIEVPDGRVIGLIGPNGAGKSTILGIFSAHNGEDVANLVADVSGPVSAFLGGSSTLERAFLELVGWATCVLLGLLFVVGNVALQVLQTLPGFARYLRSVTHGGPAFATTLLVEAVGIALVVGVTLAVQARKTSFV